MRLQVFSLIATIHLFVFLTETECLEKEAPEVYDEFMSGNFVVKRSKCPFNQVSADHATEWINKMC